ncbi:MAG: hypothetical protein GWN88_20750 [Nitrospinaceae bacterium]|nr:hypothetical protein [Nitrospinaceae bacterium]NIU46379.1 hypothetical protein [Nitrospinaceae bacterium]NIU98566.1 hypothetical protein [Nitrospinaceae bacterium]NIW61121.1 hypothetical protein [Nitrospinaceae bacterium]
MKFKEKQLIFQYKQNSILFNSCVPLMSSGSANDLWAWYRKTTAGRVACHFRSKLIIDLPLAAQPDGP